MLKSTCIFLSAYVYPNEMVKWERTCLTQLCRGSIIRANCIISVFNNSDKDGQYLMFLWLRYVTGIRTDMLDMGLVLIDIFINKQNLSVSVVSLWLFYRYHNLTRVLCHSGILVYLSLVLVDFQKNAWKSHFHLFDRTKS